MRTGKDGAEFPDPAVQEGLAVRPAATPRRKTSPAKKSFYLAVAAWLIVGAMVVVGRMGGDIEPFDPLVLFMVIPGFACVILGLTSVIYGVWAILGKIVTLLLRRPSPPIWPALVGLALTVLPVVIPNLLWIPSYFKYGISAEQYRIMDRVKSDQEQLVEKIEVRQRERGPVFPWCPLEQRKDPFPKWKDLTPDERTLPTFAISVEEVEHQKHSEFWTHPAYFYDSFRRTKLLPYGYYAPGVREGTTPTSSTGYIVWSCGPDGKYDLTAANIETAYNPAHPIPSAYLIARIYDPSNGATSAGDIVCYKTVSSK